MDHYKIDSLVDRAYAELEKVSNSGLSKISISKPEVVYNNRKTYVGNFVKICDDLNRNRNEVQKYFDAELGSTTSIDSNGCLIANGRFTQNGMMNIFGSYIKNYVSCTECSSCNTKIVKETRISYLVCNKCMTKKALSK
jgi:translation initiation factor 2 subunit 2